MFIVLKIQDKRHPIKQLLIKHIYIDLKTKHLVGKFQTCGRYKKILQKNIYRISMSKTFKYK